VGFFALCYSYISNFFYRAKYSSDFSDTAGNAFSGENSVQLAFPGLQGMGRDALVPQ
jgi:hypothetical protein